MELEFDKEIDAILRKAQGGLGVSSNDKPNHLDADSIAAFVENALPQKAKLLYMEHFADCDRCRKQLSFAISMNTGADQASAQIVSAAVAETVVPWYQKLFRSQNLAVAMGALVLSFGGLIGYLALQNKNGLSSSDVAMEKSPAASAPYSTSNSNATSNVAAANTTIQNPANIAIPNATSAAGVANVGSNSNAATSSASLDEPMKPLGRLDSTKERESSDSDKAALADTATADRSSPVTSSPPPPALSPPPAPVTRAEPSISTDGVSSVAQDKGKDDRMPSQDSSLKPAAKRNSGPSRASINAQQQEYKIENSTVLGGGSTRRVGGRTFDNRNGVWFDLAYNGQTTISVARGSREYKKLDGSIKSIAQNLSGPIVVMWKNKAYRIQ